MSEIFVNDPSFTSLKEKMRLYFEDKGVSYVDNGNFSIFLDALAYISNTTGAHISQIYNDLYLSTSNSYNVIIKLAQEIGYLQHRQINSKIDVGLTYNGEMLNSSFNINEIVFYGKKTKLYFTADSVIMSPNNSGNITVDIQAEEKVYKSLNYSGNSSTSQSIIIPDLNISNSSLIITSIIGNTSYDWNLIKDYDKLPSYNDRIYHLTYENSLLKVIFGNSVTGRSPAVDEVITIGYYTNNGIDANGETKLVLYSVKANGGVESNDIKNYSFTTSTSYGGTDYENSDDVALNAPKYFSRFGNSIIKYDFDRMTSIDSGNIKDSVIVKNYYNLNSSILGRYDFLAVPIDFYNPVEDNNNSFVLENINNLNVSEEINILYSNYINNAKITVCSPSYFILNLNVNAGVTSKVDKTQLSLDLWDDILSVTDDELTGFGKTYRVDNVYKETQSGLSSLVITPTLNWVFNKENILSSGYIKLPSNLLYSNDSYILSLQLDGNYNSSVDQDIIKTIYSDLGVSDNFIRSIISTEKTATSSNSNLCKLTFNDEVLDSNNISTFALNINNYYIKSKVTAKTNNSVSLYSVDGISYSDYKLLDETEYIVSLMVGNEEYVIGEIIRVLTPIKIWSYKTVDNTFFINKLNVKLGITATGDNMFISNNTYSNYNGTQIQIIDLSVLYKSSNITSKDYVLTVLSKQSIFEYTYDGSVNITYLNSNFTYTIIENVVSIFAEEILLCMVTINSNSAVVSDICGYPNSSIYSSFKNKSINSVVSGSSGVIYAYENISDTSIASLNIESGLIQFYNDTTYITDAVSNTTVAITIEDLLNNILSTNTYYASVKIKPNSQIQFDESSYINTNVIKPVVMEI